MRALRKVLHSIETEGDADVSGFSSLKRRGVLIIEEAGNLLGEEKLLKESLSLYFNVPSSRLKDLSSKGRDHGEGMWWGIQNSKLKRSSASFLPWNTPPIPRMKGGKKKKEKAVVREKPTFGTRSSGKEGKN